MRIEYDPKEYARDLLRLTLHRYARELDWSRDFVAAPLDRTLEAWNIRSMAELANLDEADRQAIARRALDEMRRAT